MFCLPIVTSLLISIFTDLTDYSFIRGIHVSALVCKVSLFSSLYSVQFSFAPCVDVLAVGHVFRVLKCCGEFVEVVDHLLQALFHLILAAVDGVFESRLDDVVNC